MKPRTSRLAQRERETAAALTAGGGAMGRLIAAFDWRRTALGPIHRWPQNLRTALRIVLTAHQPMFVWWGPELIHLYNDGYRGILGGKHPRALGQPAAVVWREIWHQVAPRVDSAMRGNSGTYDEALRLVMERNGYPEETYLTFSYSPIPGPDGSADGILCANTDETRRVQGERELMLLREVATRSSSARSVDEACTLAAAAIGTNPLDYPFALLYRFDAGTASWRLCGAAGVPAEGALAPATIPRGEASTWALDLAREQPRTHLVAAPPGADWPGAALRVAPQHAALRECGVEGVPVVLVAGLSPLRLWDAAFAASFELIALQISNSLAQARAYEEQHLRAERLAELDRAKTAFFTNVSHELRTPLTLILGPAEEALHDAGEPLPARQRERLELVQANAMRLLRQVSALLDFSRLQAGRIQASFEPTYLARYTTELASSFDSAAAKAGLQFNVDCPLIPDPVFLDRGLWETLVFNLVANALKFTRRGSITVRLRSRGENAVLEVEDTGIGIAADEQAHLFERFYRVPGAHGRTHGGSGIGLALVAQIARLHGGSVEVESEPGRGSLFRVIIPRGHAHLPTDQVVAQRAAEESAPGRAPLELDFLPPQAPGPAPGARSTGAEAAGRDRPRVLVAEDNRDMRLYLNRLLVQDFDVEEVADGDAALASIRRHPPELVLSDVMMPGMDGFELLRAIRADPATASIPVILLSARAGEEAGSAGMEAGADDYLIKPFHARELLARVGGHIKLRRLRLERDRQLAQAEELHRQLLESLQAGFVYLDQRLVIRYFNHQLELLAGRPAGELVGRPVWEAFPEIRGTPIAANLTDCQQRRTPSQLEQHFAARDQWLRLSTFPAPDGGCAVLVQDITADKRQQHTLIVSEKLAAAGKLAATIAHEINNPLAAVMNLVYLSRIAPETAPAHLETAERELRRVANLANQTLSFYRRPTVPTPLNLVELLAAAVQIYEPRLRSRNIRVVEQYQPAPAIVGSPNEIQQVILNLVSNAVDAMPVGGELRLGIEPAAGADAPGVWVRIADTGEGVPPETRAHLFEPFFTTKRDVGTGLGLWIVRQIVTEHHGRVLLEPGPGARFAIYLPGVGTGKEEEAA